MIDPDRLWRSLVERARQVPETPALAVPAGFAQRVQARWPAARAAAEARLRERWVFRAAAAALVAATVTVAWQWPAFAGSNPWPISLADLVVLEPVP